MQMEQTHSYVYPIDPTQISQLILKLSMNTYT